VSLFKSLITKLMSLTGIYSSVNWWGPVREPYSGAWQKGETSERKETLLSNSAVFACVTGIASDIAKLRIKLDENEKGIWIEVTDGSKNPWLPVLRKPNDYQTRINFIEQWIISKLLYGNAYILKRRDNRGIVNGLYPLAPLLVTPLVSEDGSVYYQLNQDRLSQIEGAVVAPASEIIHDRMNCLWHPLIGVPPLYACAIAANMGNKIQNSSTYFFDNRALPGGVLSAPGTISDITATRLREEWQKNFGGANSGRVAVLGDGLKFEIMQMTAQQSQLEEQLKWTVEDVARAFHYPLFKLGGPVPALAGNIGALITTYYTDCLQSLIESLELCLDEGLDLPPGKGTELDLDNLLRMDTAALFESNDKAVGGGWMKPNEARFKANFEPVPGGDSPYLQQQNYSLEALAKRDADNPFPKPAPVSPAEPPVKPPDESSEDKAKRYENARILGRAKMIMRFAA